VIKMQLYQQELMDNRIIRIVTNLENILSICDRLYFSG
jgi:hypothetical protein